MATKVREHSEAFIAADRAVTEYLDGGIARQILGNGPDLMVVRVWFDKDAVGEVHAHPHSQSTYVESVRFEVVIDGEKRVLGAGDGFYVAPHLDHGAVCIDPGVLIDTFSPAREDFFGQGA
jgi:quercetin dioxygenase-like cupin family protein